MPNREALVITTIAQCNLTIDPARAVVLLDRLSDAIEDLDDGEMQAALLLLERVILPPHGGHRATFKLGDADASNEPPCLICRRPVDRQDVALRVISRWENSQVWLTWHDYCLKGAEIEIDFDLLTGQPSSAIGFS
jgi:hypothetical protein